MEKLIFDYLTYHYYIKESQVGNDGIYKIDTTQQIPTPTNGENLIKELENIFNINESRIFILLNDWCLEQKPTVNLLFYWKTNSEIVIGKGFQKRYLGSFDSTTKLAKSILKPTLLQQYVQNYTYR